MKHALRTLAAFALVAAVAVRADDVTDNLSAAQEAYEAGNYTQAITALDAANQFIRQKKAELVAKLLPDAPKGWEASEPETEAAAAALLGGGVTASRSYSRGDASVTLKIQSDSAVMQYAMMFSNPMLLAASGAKLETIKGQSVSVAFEKGGNSGSIKAVVEGRYYLEIEGSGVTVDDLRTFAKAFDFAKLAATKSAPAGPAARSDPQPLPPARPGAFAPGLLYPVSRLQAGPSRRPTTGGSPAPGSASRAPAAHLRSRGGRPRSD